MGHPLATLFFGILSILGQERPRSDERWMLCDGGRFASSLLPTYSLTGGLVRRVLWS